MIATKINHGIQKIVILRHIEGLHMTYFLFTYIYKYMKMKKMKTLAKTEILLYTGQISWQYNIYIFCNVWSVYF